MKRRDFFKNLLGAGAAVAIAPKLFDQIVEHDYTSPKEKDIIPSNAVRKLGENTVPFQSFYNAPGLFLFDKHEIFMGWASLSDISMEMSRPLYEVTSIGQYRSYIKGKPEGWWTVTDLRVDDFNKFLHAYDQYETFHIIVKDDKNGKVYESDARAYETSWGGVLGEHEKIQSKFLMIGETTVMPMT